jgi:hypothetical protein
MSITELTDKIKLSAQMRTREQRVELLQRARILDKDGYYEKRFFSETTVAHDRKKGHLVKV